MENTKRGKILMIVILLAVVALMGVCVYNNYINGKYENLGTRETESSDETTEILTNSAEGELDDNIAEKLGYISVDGVKYTIPLECSELKAKGFYLDLDSVGLNSDDTLQQYEMPDKFIPLVDKDGEPVNVSVEIINYLPSNTPLEKCTVYSLKITGESEITLKDELTVGKFEEDFEKAFGEALVETEKEGQLVLKYADSYNGYVIVTFNDGEAVEVEYILYDDEATKVREEMLSSEVIIESETSESLETESVQVKSEKSK